MRTVILVVGLGGLGACAPPGFTPAARMIPMETATAPAVGQTDAQLDLSTLGAIFGPDTINADARLRHGLTPWLAAEVEGGITHVADPTQGYNPNALTGRVGLHLHDPAPNLLRAALIGGLGGGASPAAGNWVSADVGAVVMTNTRHVRPYVGADLFTNVPTLRPVVTYQTSDGVERFQLHPTRGYRWNVGLEAGPDDRAVILTFSAARAFRDDGIDEGFLSVGLGFRWAPRD